MKTQKMKRQGFSLVELVIVVVIIGVIAAIAVPRISRGAKGAGDAAIRATLAGMRNALDMYAAEHGGTFPDGADQAAVEAQLVAKTAFDGSAGTDFGPYLRTGFPSIPIGENKGASTITIITSGDPVVDAASVATGVAWLYSNDTGKIVANSMLADGGTPAQNYRDY